MSIRKTKKRFKKGISIKISNNKISSEQYKHFVQWMFENCRRFNSSVILDSQSRYKDLFKSVEEDISVSEGDIENCIKTVVT